ncbi:MAG: Stf0 sulfotransferase [Planctomycetota bacterium]|jgi:LPS sulfotransferase NodH
MSPQTRFLVVGLQRSGTTLVLDYLCGHGQTAVAEDEIHTALFAPGEAAEGEFLGVFDQIAGRTPAALAVGMKTAIPTAAHGARLAETLGNQGRSLDLIVVERNDLVAQYGSLRAADETGVWHSQAPRRDRPRSAVRFDETELAAYITDCRAAMAPIHKLASGRRTLHLNYENDLAPGGWTARLCSFLGIDPAFGRAPALRKVAPPPDDYIVDYSAHRATFAKCLTQPEPAPATAAPSPSRRWLLRYAEWLRDAGNLAAALAAALDSLDAPPDWGVDTNEWAGMLIGDLLYGVGDRELAFRTAERLRLDHGRDADIAPLLARIQNHLGD